LRTKNYTLKIQRYICYFWLWCIFVFCISSIKSPGAC